MKPPEENLKSQELLDQLDDLRAKHSMQAEEPPLLVDQAVRNMARRAVQATATRKLPGLGWIAGLSTASVALIALGISLVQAPQSSLPPMKPSLESMSTEQTEFRSKRANSANRFEESRSASGAAEAGAPARKAERPGASAAAVQAAQMPVQIMAPEEQSMDHFEADLADAVQKQKEQAPKEDQEATAWLDLIRQLQQQGQQAEAIAQLAAFKEVHPDFVLPNWAQELGSGVEVEQGTE
jgi:hypothetical protein